MNSKTTRIWTMLRYLAVIPLIALGVLSIVGKGGGGGGGGGGGVGTCGSIIDIDPNSTTNGTLSSGDCTIDDLFPGSGEQCCREQAKGHSVAKVVCCGWQVLDDSPPWKNQFPKLRLPFSSFRFLRGLALHALDSCG